MGAGTGGADGPQATEAITMAVRISNVSVLGFIINTHGPDDMADASVMAITEAVTAETKGAIVHEYGAMQMVIPEHQKVTLNTLFAGREVPASYIDRRNRS